VANAIRKWLTKQLHANNSLEGVAVVVKLAVTEFGSKAVARELRQLARSLEQTGEIPGWKFPAASDKTRSRIRSVA
jgi:hypothetical protein